MELILLPSKRVRPLGERFVPTPLGNVLIWMWGGCRTDATLASRSVPLPSLEDMLYRCRTGAGPSSGMVLAIDNS